MITLETKEEDDTNEHKKEKLVTATKKGSAVLDQYISDQIKSQYHVLQQVIILVQKYTFFTDSTI